MKRNFFREHLVGFSRLSCELGRDSDPTTTVWLPYYTVLVLTRHAHGR